MAQRFPGLEPMEVALDSPVHVAQRYLASAYDSVASLVEETYPALRAQRQALQDRPEGVPAGLGPGGEPGVAAQLELQRGVPGLDHRVVAIGHDSSSNFHSTCGVHVTTGLAL